MGMATKKRVTILALLVGVVLIFTCQGHSVRGHKVGPHVALLDPLARMELQPSSAESLPPDPIKEARKAANRWVDLTPDTGNIEHEGHYPGMKHDSPLQGASVAGHDSGLSYERPEYGDIGRAQPPLPTTLGSGPGRLDTLSSSGTPAEGSSLSTLGFTLFALLAMRERRRTRLDIPRWPLLRSQTSLSPELPPPR
jgi:hypothetical protein